MKLQIPKIANPNTEDNKDEGKVVGRITHYRLCSSDRITLTISVITDDAMTSKIMK